MTSMISSIKSIKDAEAIFGVMPDRPKHLAVRPVAVNTNYLDGRATFSQLEMMLDFSDRTVDVPIITVLPKCSIVGSVIVIREDPDLKHEVAYEWTGKGYAIFSFYYKDVCTDDKNFKSGITRLISPSRRKKLSPGKTVIWSWFALRVYEYAVSLMQTKSAGFLITAKGRLRPSAILTSVYMPSITSLVAPSIETDSLLTLKNSYPYLFCPNYLRADQETDEEFFI